MSSIDRMTITMPSDLSSVVKGAVEAGDYASTSEVIREAVRDWKAKRILKVHELEALRADIQKGLEDIEAGRVHDFDPDQIAERGRALLATRRMPTSPKSGLISRPKRRKLWRSASYPRFMQTFNIWPPCRSPARAGTISLQTFVSSFICPTPSIIARTILRS